MIFFDLKLLLTTSILFIASAECRVYSSNLVDLGLKLLKKIDETEFTDYKAIEDFKMSLEFAVNTSIVATPELIEEAASLTGVTRRQLRMIRDTDTVRKYFDRVFSVLTPYNDYDVNELDTIYEIFNHIFLYKRTVKIFRMLFGKRQKITQVIKKYSELPHKFHCKSTISVHHKVVALHNRAILNLIMGYTTIIYLHKMGESSSPNTELEPPFPKLKEEYNQLTDGTYDTLNSLTENLPRDIDRCDPIEHEHDETYDRLHDLVEYYFTSERFLNGNNECSATPKNYHGVKHSSEIENYIDSTLMCQGTMYQCNIVNLHHLFLYEEDVYTRYQGFSVAHHQSPDGKKLHGEMGDTNCGITSDDLNGVGERSPNYPNFNITSNELDRLKKCPIYGCYCDNHDSPRTVRYFSTKLVTSDVEHNRVITGLRLKVQNQVVYIQAQTGKLVGLGVVDPASVKWEEIEPIDVIGVDENSPEAEFVKLDYNSRSLYLDDLKIDDGYYLTGVQFARANGGVSIAAQFTPYLGETLFTLSPVQKKRADYSNRTEREIDLKKPLLSTLNTNRAPISVQNQDFIKFQPSDIENDASQTTVPFLDIQSVVTDPPTALSGFGIHLKADSVSGAFIALKLFSAKFSHDSMLDMTFETDFDVSDIDMMDFNY